ncbi:integrase [Geomicrobium sp. JCM 19037]|uniref:N-terminal phage integrase SAM-like domain-containing protein n=1 Tax=Geomicrobium sp. JCM 19037 TaxID=1460634 RepID=UPI00045F143E|nr:N-terminal phage integrase SAM-like domain-containing protein [Geomicrobium sp. JCM 19037]GAK05192.1 integrase [Geomicrobium sp. JCM 19037]
MGSIRQRGKDSWQLQVTVGVDARGYADREYKTIRAKNISEARKELAKFEAELLSGNYIRPENMTLHQLYEKEWATKYAPINYGSKATLEENVKIIEKRLLPRFGHKKIKDIKTIHIVNYISELQKDGSRLDNKPGAYRRHRSTMCIRRITACSNVPNHTVDQRESGERGQVAIKRVKQGSD